MPKKVASTSFGLITINWVRCDHKVAVRTIGEIRKRKKKLTKAVYGTSHKLSLEKAKYL
jgi:hypothetical protein